MSPLLYYPVFLYSLAVLAIVYGSRYINSGTSLQRDEGDYNLVFPLALCVILVFWMGGRPIHWLFGDTVNYAAGYVQTATSGYTVDWHGEWGFIALTTICYDLGLDVHGFFTVVEFLYIFSMLWALKILMPKNLTLALIFALTSFSFFTFGTNGIRNGLAVHLLLLAMAFYLEDRRVPAVIALLAAVSVHKSVLLPAASFVAAIYVVKKPQTAIYIWLSSIVLSFFAGGLFTGFFASLGFDDRMTVYLTTDANMLDNTTSSFRWDFLLYSGMPVLMLWTVSVKRQCSDNWYNVLGITYCLANAFWVLVIRAAFSNRFAFLSWFLYPVVVAYPLIMLNVWDDEQDKRTGTILLAYVTLSLGISFMTGMI